MDQRPPAFQERIFLIGESLAESWPGTIFISLRPDTFFQSRSRGALTAYQPRVFTVSPPRVDLVIVKRLQFALAQLEGTGRLKTFPTGLILQSQTLRDYMKVILHSFQTNPDLMALVDNLCGGNVRQALGFLTAYVGSGHVDTKKILTALAMTGEYIIPVHEFLRAVIFGDHIYYDPSASSTVNMFDISLPDGREHFLLPIVATHIERIGQSGIEQGFVDIAQIYQLCQEKLGFLPSQIRYAINRAKEKRLVETGNQSAEPIDDKYRITTIGAYSTRKLIGDFTYVDAMLVDTPIVDDEIRRSISASPDSDIEVRLVRVDLFRQYLNKQWETLADYGLTFNWKEHSESLENSVLRIRALRMRGRK